MATRMPAVGLIAVPGRRLKTLELAKEIENAGFSGIYCPSFGDNLALCQALSFATSRIEFGTSITPIYTRNVNDFAQSIAFIHEISKGRFRFGIGVSHAPSMSRLGITLGKPLADTSKFVADLQATKRVGELPPIVLAAMRQKMIKLAAEIADGMVFANAAFSNMATSLDVLQKAKAGKDNFFIGNMIPTCICDDEEQAKAVNRKTLSSYAMLPHYRNYWREAGYEEEMDAIEDAIVKGERARIASLLTDKWLADTTLYGSVAKVREGVERWFDVGINCPILVPSSARGNQLDAFKELFAAYA